MGDVELVGLFETSDELEETELYNICNTKVKMKKRTFL